MRRRAAWFAAIALVGVAAFAVVGVVAFGSGGDRELAGYARVPPPDVATAPLPDAAAGGAPFEMRADPGGLLLVYFGYTNCPDFCPTTMSDVKLARARLDEPERVQVAMVTVDPERDLAISPDCDDVLLACYVTSFVPGAHALGTDDAALLSEVAAPFGVAYNVSPSAAGEVQVEHTTSLYAVDDAGQLVLTWQFGVSIDDLTADIETLLDDEQTA